jgi:hypothetical protein
VSDQAVYAVRGSPCAWAAVEGGLSRKACLDPAPDDGTTGRAASPTHNGRLRPLVCPVSATSCWVYAARVSLQLKKPNGRECCEPLYWPCEKRDVEFCDRRIDTSTPSRCRHVAHACIIGQRQYGAMMKTLQRASGVLWRGSERRMSKDTDSR